MHYHWKQTATIKRNEVTLNSAHQAKKQCNYFFFKLLWGRGRKFKTVVSFLKLLRARLHETRSELKLVWDFTSVWGNFIINVHVTSGNVKLTLVQISLRSNWPKSTFIWDLGRTETGLKSQTALRCRSVYMAIYIKISLRQLSKQ